MFIVDDNNIRSSYLMFFVLILIPMANTVTDSEALLKLKKSFGYSLALESWKPGTDACDKNNPWKGVTCYHGKVGNLNLGLFNLSGSIDVEALVQIRSLRSLSLTYNLFSGPMPEFNRLGALKSIYLTGNKFSGEIPSDYFAKMLSLKKVWISENKFSGEIPSSLAKLTRLIELHLENNQFSGTIQDFKESSLKEFNVSNNNLRGEIPKSLASFTESSFQGNPGLCGEILHHPCNESNNDTPPQSNNHSSSRKYYIGFLVATGLILGIACFGIYVLHSKQKSDIDGSSREELDGPSLRDLTPPVQKASGSSRGKGGGGESSKKTDIVMVTNDNEKGEFGLRDLMRGAAEVLGNGALGSAYKVIMSNGFTVVVKRIKEMNQIEKNEFDAQLRRMGRIKHRNLLPPLAYHFRKEEKLLVYEYIPQKSLLHILHGDRGTSHTELNWPTRVKIIQGIARGLGHLHSELASSELPHGDLKPSNVLLSPNYEPLLTDFGYNPLINNQAKQSLTAYKSPEAVEFQQISPKSDVYCLGLIILEMISGKLPNQCVKTTIAEGRTTELVDPEIASSINISHEDVERLLHIGAACMESNPELRLDIREAISRIEDIHVDESQEIRPFSHEPPTV